MSNHYGPYHDNRRFEQRINETAELARVALDMVMRKVTVDKIESYAALNLDEPSAVLLYAFIAYFRITNT